SAGSAGATRFRGRLGGGRRGPLRNPLWPGPHEARVVAVAAGIVPREVVVSVAAARRPGGCQPRRHRMLHVVDPRLAAVIAALDALDLAVEHPAADARPPPAPVLAELDGRGPRGQAARDDRGQAAERA